MSKVVTQDNVSVGAVCTMLHWYAETGSFMECPRQQRRKKMFSKYGGLIKLSASIMAVKRPTMSAQVLMKTQRDAQVSLR